MLRVDFNVPLDKQNRLIDDSRLRAAIKTIQYILEQNGSVILISHLGRPKGEVKASLSLKHVISKLEALLGQKVHFQKDCVGTCTQKAKKDLKVGEVLLLENLRFHEAEEKPNQDPSFSEQLAKHADIYINEAFACSHRNHSSITEVPRWVTGPKAFGFELLKELKAYEQYLKDPKKPFVALVGGAKVSSKIKTLKALLAKVDTLLIAGAMAHTFFSAKGLQVGKSLNEPEYEKEALQILQEGKERGVDIRLPQDVGLVQNLSSNETVQYFSIDQIPLNGIGVDIGPQTLGDFESYLENAQTIFWNGPLGVFEEPSFAVGTLRIAHFLAKTKAITYVGGGDSTAAIERAGVRKQMTFVSTGGGASLELIEKGTLPGIDCLSPS